MPRLMLNGKIPAKEELLTDDLIVQMVKEAEEKGNTEGLKSAPTKEKIIADLKPEEVPETIKQALTKDIPTKDSVLQALTVEDIEKAPDAVKQKIADLMKPSPQIEAFLKSVTQIAKGGGEGMVNDPEGKKKSILQEMREENKAISGY